MHVISDHMSCEDLNWINDIALELPKLIHRFNEEDPVNVYGKMGKLCQHSQIYVLNGRTPGDTACFTCVTTLGSRTIDYAVVSYNLFNKMKYSYVQPITHISDHSLMQ